MIRNVTYNNPEIKAEIDQAVGPTFGWLTRIKMKGIGSRRMLIQAASPDLWHWLDRQNTAKYCYLELRPQGVIVHFRSILESFAWIIPYRYLSVFQNGKQIDLHSEGQFMKLTGINNFKADYQFLKKLMERQSEWRSKYPHVSEI